MEAISREVHCHRRAVAGGMQFPRGKVIENTAMCAHVHKRMRVCVYVPRCMRDVQFYVYVCVTLHSKLC